MQNTLWLDQSVDKINVGSILRRSEYGLLWVEAVAAYK